MANVLSDLNSQMSYPSSESPPKNMLAKMAQDIALRKQIADAQQVATGQVPHDVMYGEQGLSAPTVGGISIDPTDYIGPGELKALGGALASKLMAAKIAGPAFLAGMTRQELNIPKTEFELAHEVAQRNAALPIEQGGLGLPPDNTAMDRAKAMTGMEFPSRNRVEGSIVDMVHGPSPSVGVSGYKSGDGEKWFAKQAGYMPGEDKIVDVSDNSWEGLREKLARLGVEEMPDYIGTPDYTSVNRVFNHIPTLAEAERVAAINKARWAESKDVYLRYGELPKNQISTNYRDNTPELGTSVFNGRINPAGEVAIYPSANDQIGSFVNLQNRPVFVAKGSEVGIGADGEPVLSNVKIIPAKEYAQQSFGADGLYSTTAADMNGLVRSRFAAFDPMQRNSANILAGGLGGAVGLNALYNMAQKPQGGM